MTATDTAAAAFKAAGDMEELLVAIQDIATGIALLAEGIDEDASEGKVIQRMAWTIREKRLAAEELRGKLWRLTHPRRDHFEKEGWPGDLPDQPA